MENIQLEIALKSRKQKKQVKNTEGLFSTNMQSHCTHPWLAYPSLLFSKNFSRKLLGMHAAV
jgi:hypothetical protein